ncbi:hypothetical protein [Maribacter sp. ACAM166]|uniref:hypothetical protein n=1 Tax=Maribacter sp. ACAM166 TaxID=2508996 RepID=UPI0010FD47A9|nr:hypothetical protein [Maribacter sp. ACAM166]TLP71217.1 hypothetical protein ES765_19730 [Maribacter sp. ACAM166]
MKITNIFFALAIGSMITITSCKDANTKTETTEEHGHEHDGDGNHKEDKNVVEQEEFNVNGTSENKEGNSDTNEQTNEATIVVKANKALESIAS